MSDYTGHFMERENTSLRLGYLLALKTMAKGCKEHPSYRGHRYPTADCDACKKVWEASATVSTEVMS